MYAYVRFGTLLLPPFMDEHEIGTGASRATFRPLPDGSQLRSYGSGRAALNLPPLRRTAQLIEASPAALVAAYAPIRARTGTVAKLYRRDIDGSIQWIMAEMTEDAASTSHAAMFPYGASRWVQSVPLTFTPLGPVWNGPQHGIAIPNVGDEGAGGGVTGTHDTDVYPLANGDIALTNGAAGLNVPVNYIVIRATAAVSPITAFTLGCGLAKWTWTGSIAVGQVLTIDTASQRVLNNGVAAYSGFVRDAAHQLDSWNWLRLEPGANTVTLSGVAGGGAGSTISFSFFDGHA